MLITPTTKTVTTYVLELSDQDAQACLADPYTFVDHLAEQLRAAGADGGKPARVHRNGWHKQRDEQFTHERKAKARKPSGGGHACPHCGRTFKRAGFLARHVLRAHGTEAAPAE